LGDKLLPLAEQAYGFRDGERILELSQALLALPLPDEYKSAARYFQALGLRRRGEIEKGDLALEQIAMESTHRYTARALQSFGAILQDRGDFDSAVKLYVDAGRRAAETGRVDYMTISFLTQRNIAKIMGLNGDNRGALTLLERLSPLARAVGSNYPHAYYDYLNNLAVECGDLGRLEQAAQACRIALSSPFSAAYPEWRETSDEIESKRQRASRSVVAVPQRDGGPNLIEEGLGKSHNVVHLPVAERIIEETSTDRYAQFTRARVLDFRQRKTAIEASSRTAPEGITAEQRSRMTTGEKLIRLMDLISQDETDDETIDRILEAVEQIVPNRRSQELD